MAWMPDRLRAWLSEEQELFRKVLTFHWPDKVQRHRLHEIMDEGGLTRSQSLTQGGPLRLARLIVQIDGDVLLLLPRDHGAYASDATDVENMLAATAIELHALHQAMPYSLAALFGLLTKTGFAAAAVYHGADAVRTLFLARAINASVLWTAAGILGLTFGKTLRRRLLPPIVRGIARAIRYARRLLA